MSKVFEISTAQFGPVVLQSDLPVVVDLYAHWCGPCRAMAPILDRYAQAYEGKVKFVKVDIDAEPAIAEYFQVSSIPTLLFFREGQLVQRQTGLPDGRAFQGVLDRLASLPGARAA